MTPAPTLSFTAQVRHQLHREWQQHHLWALALVGFIALRAAYLTQPFWHAFAGYKGEPYWLQYLALFFPAILFMRVVMAEPLASTDLGTLTRPLSRWALVVGKGVFLTLAVLLPWLLADAWQWRGFGHSPGTWVALLLGSAQAGLMLALLFGALASLTTSVAQLSFLLLGLVAFYIGMDLTLTELRTFIGWDQAGRTGPPFGQASAFLNSLAYLVPSLLFLAVLLVQAIGRRRWLAGVLLALGITLGLAVPNFWLGLKWLELPLPTYTGSALTITPGPASAPVAGQPTQPLWPTLHLSGLPPRHMAMVVHFAPPGKDLNKARVNWRKNQDPYFWRDENMTQRQHDRAKILLGQYPSTQLSYTSPYFGQVGRSPMSQVLGPTLPTQPWQLRLAVYEMRKLVDLPLADFLHTPPTFLLKSGRRLEFQPLKETRSSYLLPWTACFQTSRLLPAPLLSMDDLPRFGEGGVGGAWAVLRDGTVGENHLLPTQHGRDHTLRSGQFYDDVTYSWEFHLPKPQDRQALTGLALDTWMKKVRVEIWLPELRGLTDLEVTPEEMQRMVK